LPIVQKQEFKKETERELKKAWSEQLRCAVNSKKAEHLLKYSL
jgi:hypothetical protein